MKRFLLFWIFILMVLAVFAKGQAGRNDANGRSQREPSTHVTAAQAMDVGYAFMHTGSGSKRGGTQSGAVRKQAMQLVYTGKTTDSLTRAITDCYYVFALQPKGFVIVTADERVNPILGYSYDNDFVVENMPEHVRGWLGGYERQIKTAMERDVEPATETTTKWSRLKSGQPMSNTRNGNSVGPLLTTTWNQGQYYNNLCPADANGPAGHVYTGCVATAMAQIINYHQYPQHGRGTHSYGSNYGTLTVNYGSANYDYTNMPDALTYASNTAEVNAVATLMRDCGVAVNMGYAADESSAFDQEARAALINFFRYSPNMSFAEKAYFTNDEWETMLRNDLDAGNPVYYSGQGTGGHAFVCDGYNTDGYFSFNFGWGGYCNGWYLTSNVNPGGSTFNDSQGAIFGITPDSTGNVILGQMTGTSTFTVDEPIEFYHLMGHNAYEGGNYDNSCSSTVNFVPANSTNQIVADVLDFEDQSLSFYDGNGNELRNLYGGGGNDLRPVVSSQNALRIGYFGNLYYAGFNLSISQTNPNECRMVSNIASHVDTTTVHLTWTENGNATQWEIEYGVKGFTFGTGTLYTATTNTVTIGNLQPLTEYDFYIRSVCDGTHYGPRGKTTLMVEGSYWQDIVTSQPEGYVYDAATNSVQISTAEQLAWWAKTGNGIDGHLTADIDLSGYKWQPTGLSGRNFNGHGHVITNLFVIQGSGFFSECAEGCIIENIGLTNAYVSNNSEAGGLCGTLRGTMRNCYVTNSLIQVKNDETIEHSLAGGLVCMNLGDIINCYVNADVVSYYQGGLLACYSYGTVRNCYATGSLPHISWCYYGSIAAVASGEISHCYSNAAHIGFISYQVGLLTITDVSFFESSGNGWSLLTPIVFEDVTESDLLSALNRGVEMYNDSVYNTWMADTGNINGGYPVFGSKYDVQCPSVTDVSIQNVIVNNQHAVMIGWTENGDASQWLIRYKNHNLPDTVYSYVMSTSNPDTLYGIQLGHEYDFDVRAICGADHRSGWCTRTEIIDLPYWTDIVTTKPDGYVEDADGNVEIYSAEGLTWFAAIMNGPYHQQYNAFSGKTVTLKSDIDLSGYRWDRIGHDNDWGQGAFCGTFDGQNHRISNIYMNSETGGLFGGVWNGGVVKNVILEGGSITCGRGFGGGVIGRAVHCREISNCHVSTTIHSRYSVPIGALCGEIQCGNSQATIVSNCSTSGTVYGGSRCGNLIGHILGNVEIRNCYATGDVYPASEITGDVYCRGVMIGYFEEGAANNCFSTGIVFNCPPAELNISDNSCYGKVIGCFGQPNIHYLYGQNSINAGLAEYGLEEFTNNSLFNHSGNTNTLLSPISIEGTNHSDLLDALNAWVALQNDTSLRTWVLDTLTGFPVFGNFHVPTCYNPTDLTLSQATVVGDPTIKTRLAWTQKGEPDHWEVLYVASGGNIESGTIISVSNNPCVIAGIPVGQPLDFYVRAICSDNDTSGWCNPVTYIPDKLRWTEVVTSQPEGYQECSDGNVYISSAEGLSWVASMVNRLNGNGYHWFGNIILTKDIDLSAYRWTAIGNSWEHACYHSFNGNNHVVSGLYCNESSEYQGLFGIMGNHDIQNLTLNQCDVRGTGETGAIVGHINGSLRNCMVNGSVSGPAGLVGIIYNGKIENSCFISKDNKLDYYDEGGFLIPGFGYSAYSEMSNCYVGVPNTSVVSNRYYNHAIMFYTNGYYSDFSGYDHTWTLNSPLYINGAFHSDLLDALNAWVDENNLNGQYNRWAVDTNMVNGGFPVFESVSLPSVSSQDTVVVQGYYSWHGMVFTSDTVVTDTIPTFFGYDSVVTYHIFVNPAPITEITIDTCSSYVWNGETYFKTGDYVQTFTSANNADSVVILRLTINPLTGVDEQIICDNSYTWIDGVTYVTNNNTATYMLQTADGCDSVVTLRLTFNQPSSGDTTAMACESFTWYDITYTQSGDYQHTMTNTVGCDSVVTLHLTINCTTYGDTTAVACESFTWYGTIYTQTGDYTRSMTNAAGYDSVVTLHLTIHPTYTVTDTQAICAGELPTTWNGIQFTEAGTQTVTLQTVNGCDSVVTMILTTLPTTTGIDEQTACRTFRWIDGYTYTESTNEPTFTLTNSIGCDSVVTLHLTINRSSIAFDEQIACESFTWIDGNTYTESTNGPTFTLTNAAGCDSLVILYLTIGHPTTAIDEQIACESFTWIDSNTYTESTNEPTFTLTNTMGCDSVVTLHLTINHLPTVTTAAVSNIATNWVTCGGNVIHEGGAAVTARGVCWSTSQNPTIADAHTTDGTGMGPFASNITGLTPNTTYYARAYASNNGGTSYGEEVTFTSADFTPGTFICGDNLVVGNDSYSTYQYGSQCWMTQNMRNVADILQPCPSGWHLPNNDEWNLLGNYLQSSPIGFDNGHYLCVMPWQDGYGNQYTLFADFCVQSNNVSFTGQACEIHDYASQNCITDYYPLSIRCVRGENALPTVITSAASDIAATSAVSGGNITDDGGAAVTAKGVCWSTSQNPTIADAHTTDGIGTGAFTSNITGLTPNTTYYLRAYATNFEGTSYGQEANLTTPCDMAIYEFNVSTCDSYVWSGTTYTESGHYPITFTSVHGCDSVVTLHLTVNQATTRDTTAVACGSFTWYGTNYTQTGDYTRSLTNAAGCDSIVTLHLTINPIPEVAITGNTNICPGGGTLLTATGADNYLWSNGSTNSFIPVNVFGVYSVTGMNTTGCSNMTSVTVLVTQPPVITITGETNICAGESTTLFAHGGNTYLWNNGTTDSTMTVNNAGSWQVIGYDANGCNSMANVSVNVWQPATTSFSATACNSYTWNDSVYTQSGDYPQILQTVHGCDSVVTLHLTVNHTTTGDTTAVACESFTWYGTTYTQTGDYTRSLTNAAGCDSIVTLHLTISQIPEVVVTATETSICVGGSATVMAEVYNMYDGYISYSWSDGSYGSLNTFLPITSGSFTFTVTATHLPSGCASIGEITINVNDKPETPVVTVDNALIYDGGLASLSVINPTANAVYTWYRNGVLIVEATNYVLTDYLATNDGDVAYYSYTVRAQLPMSGCVSDISANTDVTVAPSPTAVVSVEGNTMFCEGASTTLHVDVTPYHPSYTYQWYMDNELIPGATSTDYVVSEPARLTPYSFHVVVSANGGYTGIAYAPTITVVPSPTVVASISESSICVGGTATLTATVEGGVAGINGYNFQWFGIEETSTLVPELVGIDSSYTISGYKPAGSYLYWVMVSSEYGCNVQSDVVILSVVSQPAITITRAVGYDETVCEGGSTAIQANVTGGYAELSYQWYENGYILADETNQNLAINNLAYGVNDSYTVVVSQTGAGCSNSASADINTLVSIYPIYTVAVSGPNDICEGGNLTMFAEVNNVIPGDMLSYQWHEIMNGQDILIEGANSAICTTVDLQSGSLYEYYVVVNSNLSGCTATSSAHEVNVNALSHTNLYETTCEYYIWNDTIYSESGEYTQTYTNTVGCDSVVTLHLTVNHTTYGDTTATACDSFDWYEHMGIIQSCENLTHTFINAAGCDSIVTLHLTVNQTTYGDTTAIVCGSFDWYGMHLAQSGDYYYTLTNVAGCDSVVTLHFTVNQPTTGIDVQIACGSFTWIDGVTYTENNSTATCTLSNAMGCDSIVTLHLTINTATEGDTIATVCESFDWYGTHLTQSGEYTHTIANVAGCDSVVTLHLTINQPTTGTDVQIACGSFTWIDGVTYTESNNTATYPLTNTAGCDSIVTLYLTVNQPVTTTSSAIICDSELPYVWNGVTFNEAGTQNLTLQTVNGCDSIVEMTLTVNPSFSFEAYLTISENDLPFTYGDTTFMLGTVQSGDYVFNFTTADGCDSVIILHLTVETGINDYALNASMKLYPNPTKDVVNVQLTMNNEQLDEVGIQVFDVYGRLLEVVNMMDARSASVQTTQIDLSRYANGVYLIKAVAEGNVLAVRKVVKK